MQLEHIRPLTFIGQLGARASQFSHSSYSWEQMRLLTFLRQLGRGQAGSLKYLTQQVPSAPPLAPPPQPFRKYGAKSKQAGARNLSFAVFETARLPLPICPINVRSLICSHCHFTLKPRVGEQSLSRHWVAPLPANSFA
jgi:hypothetical protein